MNRIFYDSISDLPSGGGEQERREVFHQRRNERKKMLQERVEEYSRIYKKAEETLKGQSGIPEEDGNVFCLGYVAGHVSRQSEIDSLSQELQTFKDAYAERNDAVNQLKEQNQKLAAVLSEIDKSLYMGPDLADEDILKWYIDVVTVVKDEIKALLNQQPG